MNVDAICAIIGSIFAGIVSIIYAWRRVKGRNKDKNDED